MTAYDIRETLVPIFAIVFTFGFPAIIIFWAIYTKHRERMRLIEKGISPEEARKYFTSVERRPRNTSGALKWGIILLFLGIGIFVANILEQYYEFNDGISFGMIVLFLGAGFVIYHFLSRGRDVHNDSQGVNIPKN
jgi:phosphatidylglycerophosphate synthase